MGILVLVEAVPKPGSVDELVQFLQMGLPQTRSADGCQGIQVYLEDSGNTVVAVESWQSKAHYEKYLDWRKESGAMEALGQRLQSPLQIRYFDPLNA